MARGGAEATGAQAPSVSVPPARGRTLAAVVVCTGVWTCMLFAAFEWKLAAERESMAEQLSRSVESMKRELQRPGGREASTRPTETSQVEAGAPAGVAAAAAEPAEALQASSRRARKLGGIMSVAASASNSGSEGCLTWGGAALSVDMSSTACLNSKRCPFCFIFTGAASDLTLTVQKCGTSSLHQTSGLAMTTASAAEFIFINSDADNVATIKATDGSGTVVSTYHLAPYHSVVGYCYGDGGHRILFPYDGTAHSAGATPSAGYCPWGCEAAAPVYKTAAAGGTAFTYKGLKDFTGSTIMQFAGAGCATTVCTSGACATSSAIGCENDDFSEVTVMYR